MALISILLAITSINLIKPQANASVDAVVSVLISDLRQQQSKSTLGQNGTTQPLPFGIYFEANRYTLFANNYDPTNTLNFIVDMESNISLQTTPALPGQILFLRRSGEIDASSISEITVTDNPTGVKKTIKLNKFGSYELL